MENHVPQPPFSGFDHGSTSRSDSFEDMVSSPGSFMSFDSFDRDSSSGVTGGMGDLTFEQQSHAPPDAETSRFLDASNSLFDAAAGRFELLEDQAATHPMMPWPEVSISSPDEIGPPRPDDLESKPLKREGKPKRIQGPRGSSCEACRKGKRKCDEDRPCRRCVAKGPDAEAQCVRELLEKREKDNQVARPIKYRTKSIDIAGVSPGLAAHKKLPHPMLAMGMMNAVPQQVWIDIFNNLTPRLHKITMDILNSAFEKMQAMMAAAGSGGNSPSPSSPKTEENAAHKWAESARCGFIAMDFAEDTGRRSCVSVNKFGSWGLFDMHREEALSRLAQDELKLPTTQLRNFCLLFDFLVGPADTRATRYLLATRRQDATKAVFIRSSNKRHHLPDGRLKSYTATFAVLSPEEYDSAINQAPDLGEPLVKAAGRTVSGADIFASGQIMEEENMKNMLETEEGRRGMDNLANELTKKFSFLLNDAPQ